MQGVFFKILNDNKIFRYQPSRLIGTAGPFELLPLLLGEQSQYNRKDILNLSTGILKMDHNTRVSIKGMPRDRADMSLESFGIIRFILDYYPDIQKVVVVKSTLKEGVIAQYLE